MVGRHHNFQLSTTLIDFTPNREASTFMAENYPMLLNKAEAMGVHSEMSSDLLHDVIISIIKDEDRGCGFDPGRGNLENDITVEQFVLGRMKGYTRNKKYCHNAAASKDVCEIPASFENGDWTENSSFQIAYMNAIDYDVVSDMDEAETIAALDGLIDNCLDFEYAYHGNIVNLLLNLQRMDGLEFDPATLASIREACKLHDEFGEALRNILEASINNREILQSRLKYKLSIA